MTFPVRRGWLFAAAVTLLTSLVDGDAGSANATGQTRPGDGKGVRPGRWHRFPTERFEGALTPEQREHLERLEAIGYVAGSSAAPGFSGVVVHDPARAWRGLNFYTSGHGCEALLVDMEGNVLHSWARDYEEVFPDDVPANASPARVPGLYHWRRAKLLPGGDVLVIWEGQGIARLDRDSNVVWARHNGAHHDLQVMASGDIYVLARTAHVVKRVHPTEPILEDFIVVLDAHGNEKQRVSLLEAFENSAEYGPIWSDAKRREGDIFHTNSIEVLDGRIGGEMPAFAAGHVLVSMLMLDTIAAIDLDRKSVAWAAQGEFSQQHDPGVLPDGNLMLFDNRGLGDRSAVRIYEPASMHQLWVYSGTPEQSFYSKTCGTAQQLPNGNILVTESDTGRALELTADQEIVWEFFNPHRAGDEQEFIATLFDVLRLPADFPLDWIAR